MPLPSFSVQACRRLPEESDREVANLFEIKDHYPKYVVTLDELAAGNINGVKIVHLADFLLSNKYWKLERMNIKSNCLNSPITQSRWLKRIILHLYVYIFLIIIWWLCFQHLNNGVIGNYEEIQDKEGYYKIVRTKPTKPLAQKLL